MLQIYSLERPGGQVHYDEVDSVVVMAETALAARQYFAGRTARDDYDGPGNEGREVWLDRTRSKVTHLGTARDPYAQARVVCRSYNAG